MNLLSKGILEKIRWGRDSQFNHSKKPKKVTYICGADLMVRACVLGETQGFSPAFFMYYEETELCFRIKQLGYAIYSLPDAKIQHLEGKSFNEHALNTFRILCLEKSLSIYHELHTGKLRKKIIQMMRLLRLNIKYYVISRKSYTSDLYWKRRRIILGNCN